MLDVAGLPLHLYRILPYSVAVRVLKINTNEMKVNLAYIRVLKEVC
jgi:hypothetical protein